MINGTRIVFLPGSANIDPIQAIEKGLAKLGRPRRPFYRGLQYLGNIKAASIPKAAVRYSRPLVKVVVKPAMENNREKVKRVRRELIDAGSTWYGLLKAESRYLPKLLHQDEHVEAVIYGQHRSSSAMLAATNERIIYLDKKPMVEMFDEVSYEVVSGIEFDIHTLFSTVVLHTPVKNYTFKFVNLHCAEKFTRHIEKQRLEKEEAKAAKPAPRDRAEEPERTEYPGELKDDMAGYYWLPTEEEEGLS